MTSSEPGGRERVSEVASLVAAIATISVAGVGLSLSVALLAIRMEAAGYSSASIGFSTSVSGLANALGAPLVPYVTRLLGARTFLICSILVGAACLLAFSVTPIRFWLLLRFVYGGAIASLFVLSEFAIVSAAPSSRRGLITGLYATALALGFTAGPALLGLTGSQGDLPFWSGAGLFLAALIPVWLAGQPARPLPNTGRVSLLTMARTVPLATGAALVFGVFEAVSMSLFPVYALRLGLSAAAGAALVSLSAFGNMAFQIPLGLLGDKLSSQLLLSGCGFVGAAGALAMWLAGSDMAVLGPVVFVWGGITAGLYTLGLAQIGDEFSGSELASANAAVVMLYSWGLTAGPPTVGLLMDATGASGLPLGLFGLFTAFVALALWCGSRGHSGSAKT